MERYYADGCSLHFEGGVMLVFKSDVWKTVEINDILIVLTEMIGKDTPINNIYGIIDCEVAWQIENARPQLPEPTPENGAYYSYLAQYDKDPTKLLVWEASGYRFIVDPMTGKIVGRESWTK